jgi:hypothetical protein
MYTPQIVITYPANSYCSQANYCIPLDDGRMTETCCGNNIRRAAEELLR